ncbi:MAG TPA: hypothetical protein VFA05_03455 [Gaiellaceae bacterium]|nr:hypothetical protein [Gaiellaceae bacterium]
MGVIDVGSNTVRLLVTRDGRCVHTEREMLRLGADVEQTGAVTEEKLGEVAHVVAHYADEARTRGADAVEVLITSPGRQAANGEELQQVLARAAAAPARVLSAAEEGRLAFAGAVAFAGPPARRVVAVVDVGGGSAQVVVGTRRDGPRWTRSIDLGSQRLTSRLLADDPPGRDAIAAAAEEVEGYLHEFAPPQPRTAYAVGGSARALKQIVGARLSPHGLDEALELLATTPRANIAAKHGIDVERARTLAAGAVILAALQRRLGVPLRVTRGGVREGAAGELARTLAA